MVLKQVQIRGQCALVYVGIRLYH